MCHGKVGLLVVAANELELNWQLVNQKEERNECHFIMNQSILIFSEKLASVECLS